MAKNKKTKNVATPAKKPIAWLITGLIGGLLVAGCIIFYLDNASPPIKQKQQQVKKFVASSAQEPQFDFYSILPDMSLSEITQKKPTPPATPTQAATTGGYLIQVASFTHYSDADRLKAKLTLDGHAVHVKEFTKDGLVWYRVMIGPYSNKEQAKIVQNKLLEQKIDSLLVKHDNS